MIVIATRKAYIYGKQGSHIPLHSNFTTGMNILQDIDQDKESKRLESLRKYNVLDTPPDGSFDHITKLAAKLLEVPIAIVTLVDTDRIWFKSRYGLEACQIGRDPGLCASAILSDQLYLVEDALIDARTLANPLVAGEFGLRFYAAVPLTVKDGHNLGTLCVIDRQPRQLTDLQRSTLQSLGEILIDQLELRLAARTAISKQNQLLSVAAHDLKNPLAAITAISDLIKKENGNGAAVDMLCDKIKDASGRMNRKITHLLESASKDADDIRLQMTKVDFSKMVAQVVSSNQVLASNKNLLLQLDIQQQPIIDGDEEKLLEAIDNLVNNAIKYSPYHKNISIIVDEVNGYAIFQIKDEGQGFTEADKENMFQRFSRLSAQPTGGESSTGLGLSIVKTIVEAHRGSVSAESAGTDKGSTFTIALPVK